MAVLPHYSPGYPEWDIAEQPRAAGADPPERPTIACPAELEVLDSGMLRPKKSLLAVFGLTRHADRVAPAHRAQSLRKLFVPAVPVSAGAVLGARRSSSITTSSPRRSRFWRSCCRHARRWIDDAKYAVNAKALARWAAERLTLTRTRERHDRRALSLRGDDLHATWAARCFSTIT